MLRLQNLPITSQFHKIRIYVFHVKSHAAVALAVRKLDQIHRLQSINERKMQFYACVRSSRSVSNCHAHDDAQFCARIVGNKRDRSKHLHCQALLSPLWLTTKAHDVNYVTLTSAIYLFIHFFLNSQWQFIITIRLRTFKFRRIFSFNETRRHFLCVSFCLNCKLSARRLL